jgi:thiamine biosynthesis lipoprotein
MPTSNLHTPLAGCANSGFKSALGINKTEHVSTKHGLGVFPKVTPRGGIGAGKPNLPGLIFGQGRYLRMRDNAPGFQLAGTGLNIAAGADIEPPCGGSAGLARSECSAYIMGSTFSVVAYGSHFEQVESAANKALDEARRLDRMLSNYRADSELTHVNRSAGRRPVKVSSEFFDFLSACASYSRASEGTFDITVGPLIKLAGFYRGAGRIPNPDEVALALPGVDYRNVVLDEKRKTVRFTRDNVELDPGGAGKGFAVDKMAEVLEREQVQSALISAGGSTLYALGAPPGKPGWKVSIKDPRHPSRTAESVNLTNESISTSGSYERSLWADGKIWSHIIDPRTGYPAVGTLSVSVVAAKALDSEAWAKPYYIQGRAWTGRHKLTAFRVFYCEDMPNTAGVWL